MTFPLRSLCGYLCGPKAAPKSPWPEMVYYNEIDPYCAQWLRNLIGRRDHQGCQGETPKGAFLLFLWPRAHCPRDIRASRLGYPVRCMGQSCCRETWRHQTNSARARTHPARALVNLQGQCEGKRTAVRFVVSTVCTTFDRAMRLLRRRSWWWSGQIGFSYRIHIEQLRAVLFYMQLRKARDVSYSVSGMGESCQ